MDADDSLERLAGEDQAETAVHAAHMQYTAACCALRAAIALCLEAFVEGHVTAATLGRACRTSLADPKKVIIHDRQYLNNQHNLSLPNCLGRFALTHFLSYVPILSSLFFSISFFRPGHSSLSTCLRYVVCPCRPNFTFTPHHIFSPRSIGTRARTS